MGGCDRNMEKKTQTFRVERSHVSGLVGIEGPDLNLVLQNSVGEPLKEHFVDCHIKSGNNL